MNKFQRDPEKGELAKGQVSGKTDVVHLKLGYLEGQFLCLFFRCLSINPII